jgi:hypothetical protein
MVALPLVGALPTILAFVADTAPVAARVAGGAQRKRQLLINPEQK